MPVFNNDLASKDIPFKDGMTQKSVFIYKFSGWEKKSKDFLFIYVFFPIYVK